MYRAWLLLFLLLPFLPVAGQMPDSLTARQDSLSTGIADSVRVLQIRLTNPLDSLLQKNQWLNTKATPVSMMADERKVDDRDAAFYILAVLLLFLGVLKMAYPRYFSNLQRVFFNSSLRQSQLTDQLLQAKLPSLLFNIFFVLMAGYYVFLLTVWYGKAAFTDWPVVFPVSALVVMVIYLGKFWVLHFAGWLTGYRSAVETYVFIVFLINKMIALVLAPLVIIISFSQAGLARAAVIASFVLVGLMTAMRFFRSYALLQHGIRVSRLHFFLYVVGAELLPLFLIYKAAILFIGKNL